MIPTDVGLHGEADVRGPGALSWAKKDKHAKTKNNDTGAWNRNSVSQTITACKRAITASNLSRQRIGTHSDQEKQIETKSKDNKGKRWIR